MISIVVVVALVFFKRFSRARSHARAESFAFFKHRPMKSKGSKKMEILFYTHAFTESGAILELDDF
jgi:hypothetical protein